MLKHIALIKKGQIRHPKRLPQALMKCSGPLDGEAVVKGQVVDLNMYLITQDFPKPHYIVVSDVVESFTENGQWFCVSHLITHSSNFENAKITPDLYMSSIIRLNESYVTRDKFLINFNNVEMKRVFGNFDLDKLEELFKYY